MHAAGTVAYEYKGSIAGAPPRRSGGIRANENVVEVNVVKPGTNGRRGGH